MDDETAELILTTQLQDLEDVRSKSAGKGREGDPLSDSYLALQLQREELEQAAGVVTDRRMAQSIHRAVQDDGASIVILASEENQAAADRSMACRLDGQAPPTGPSFPDLMADDATLIRYGAFNIQDDGNETAASVAPAQDNEAESSTTAATRKRKRPNDEEECIACREVKPIVEAPCQHLYCRDCVRHLFNNAVVDETLFPPRCCRQQIPVSLVRRFLGPNLTISFERKAIEYGTTNRTYCSDATCATFIDPTHMHGSTGICPRRGCGNLTCITCKRTEHVGACPREDPFEDTIRLAQEAGWQRYVDVDMSFATCVVSDGNTVNVPLSMKTDCSTAHSRSPTGREISLAQLVRPCHNRKESRTSPDKFASAMTVTIKYHGVRLMGRVSAKNVRVG